MIATLLTCSDVDIAARTVWGEARSESYEGMKAVAHVLWNRYYARHRKENTLAGIATEPYQFSCWLDSDPNRAKLHQVTMSDPKFRLAWRAVLEAHEENQTGDDPTSGAQHYKTAKARPKWALGHEPVAVIGRHQFYAGIR